MAETYEQWANNRLKDKPVFNEFDEALKFAREKAKKRDYHDIWQEPKKRGGKYACLTPDAFEAAYRMGYKRLVPAIKLDMIDALDEVE